MLKNTLDILLGPAILASTIFGRGFAEAILDVYSRITGKQSAQVANCGQLAQAGQQADPVQDAPWKELPEKTLVDALPVFVRGAAKSPLRVQIVLDYDCPFSQMYVHNVLPGLSARDDTRLEIYDYFLPFHPNAEQAARAVRYAAKQGHYVEFVIALADYHPTGGFPPTGGYETPDDKAIMQAAKAAGLDAVKLLQYLPTQENNVELDLMVGQEAGLPGISGTPTTIINGRAIVGAFEWTVIERLLEEAQP